MNQEYEHVEASGSPMKSKSSSKIIAIIAIVFLLVSVIAAAVYVYTSNVIDFQGSIFSDPTEKSNINSIDDEDNTEESIFVTGYDDYIFLSWTSVVLDELLDDVEYISYYLDLDYYSSAANWYAILKNDAETYLDEIDDFSVSSKWQPIKSEFKKYLEDIKWAGYYGELALKYFDTNDFDRCIEYTEKSTAHLETVTFMVENL